MRLDRTTRRPLAYAAALLCAASPIVSTSALAQANDQNDGEATPSGGGIADIVVTAQR